MTIVRISFPSFHPEPLSLSQLRNAGDLDAACNAAIQLIARLQQLRKGPRIQELSGYNPRWVPQQSVLAKRTRQEFLREQAAMFCFDAEEGGTLDVGVAAIRAVDWALVNARSACGLGPFYLGRVCASSATTYVGRVAQAVSGELRDRCGWEVCLEGVVSLASWQELFLHASPTDVQEQLRDLVRQRLHRRSLRCDPTDEPSARLEVLDSEAFDRLVRLVTPKAIQASLKAGMPAWNYERLHAEVMYEFAAAMRTREAGPSGSSSMNTDKAVGHFVQKTYNITRRPDDPRNAWIYEQCCAGTPHGKIVEQLKKMAAKKGWSIISTIQGIRSAAARYAEDHDKPHPPPRRDSQANN